MPTQGISGPEDGAGADHRASTARNSASAPIDVGGGFGVRNEIYPEFLAVMLAAKRTGRPVKWTGTRSETMSGDHHGRARPI